MKTEEIHQLINNLQLEKAQFELSKFGNEFLKDPEYLMLRGKLLSKQKRLYLAIDTLLLALEFSENDLIFELLSQIYNELQNYDLSKKFLNKNQRLNTAKNLKKVLSGLNLKNN